MVRAIDPRELKVVFFLIIVFWGNDTVFALESG